MYVVSIAPSHACLTGNELVDARNRASGCGVVGHELSIQSEVFWLWLGSLLSLFWCSQMFTITTYLSTGVTSRGRIGIDAALSARPLVQPWFTDPIDKAVLITGINDIVGGIRNVSGMTLVTPDNTSTIQQYGTGVISFI